MKAQQERLGSRRGGFRDSITEDLAHFVGELTTIYLGTATAEGQP